MKPPNEPLALRKVASRLTELLDLPLDQQQPQTIVSPPGNTPDGVLSLGGLQFVVEWKGSSGLAQVSYAVDQVRRYASALGQPAVPLLAVPFMGPAGREHCRAAGVSWLDLSGNANISAPGIRVRIEGQPNLFKRPGRPSSAFAPKSSRIARWLLLHPGESMTQREIAAATSMDEGFTSRIVARLAADELVVRQPSGAIQVRDPDLLLDAWREVYDFTKHQIVKGHVAARSGEALARRIADALRNAKADHAATGLAAAWMFTRFAGFRTVATYVAGLPSPDLLGRLGFREESSGANVWWVVPADEGVFQGASDRDGVRCVHPVQAYLDLKDPLERANEAAASLRAERLSWRADG